MSSKLIPIYITLFLSLITSLGLDHSSSVRGFNYNEWIFGYYDENSENSHFSFGKGTRLGVQKLPGSVIVDRVSNAIALDPITGQPLFYSNGTVVYDYSGNPMKGIGNLNGSINVRQQVATGFLNYEPGREKLYYLFYISPSGQLLYSLIDMNTSGQGTGKERHLGEVVEKNEMIGNAQGAILVIKTHSSPSYLISFDKGNLVARRLNNKAGDFTQTNNQAIPFTPKAIIFDEDREQLILIPENPRDDILVLCFNSDSGNFGPIESIKESGGSEPIEGVTFSPNKEFIYFSRGSQLFRVSASDLSSFPEKIVLDPKPSTVYDLKVGPDGELYIIYEESDDGPQLMAKIANANEGDLIALTVEMDPFAGTDLNGTIFSVFGPNAAIEPSIDFSWMSERPCINNPLQLVSEISPKNYQPVSFSWDLDPPLTDSLIDQTKEHFLVPAQAVTGSSLTASLTVTFADGKTKTITKSIPLNQNTLTANFSPRDTTLCEGQCIDIGSLIQLPSEDKSGYEFFWSNFPEEGWTNRIDNEICLPGIYWVLVREQGTSCYSYAEINIRIFDLIDLSLGTWLFGDGAGLNFNPDPIDSLAPIPRPLENRHPQNIQAGVTTVTDKKGQPIFYTDGDSVWDMNGNLLENGENIGGDNFSSGSVLAIDVPKEQTLYYLFTTQSSSKGSNEVRFSLVDLKGENPKGPGKVVDKDNFLFSPSTEHSDSFINGDTTWVLFHELGNNRFRAYPVTKNGVGKAVLSAVGSPHGSNTGVGSMKFSPSGSKVAVTISEGGCNKLELFDFDVDTGSLTAYASLDLGCVGKVYGVEFSSTGNQVLVSFNNGGPGVVEFNIGSPNAEGQPICHACFNNSENKEELESCILSTRKQISGTSGLNLGALQIGPDGKIYLAIQGSNKIGQITVPGGCNSSTLFSQSSVGPMLGTSNLGLPTYEKIMGNFIPEPKISGNLRLCQSDENEILNEEFNGGGEPDIDSYFWTITLEDGTIIFDKGGFGEEFQKINYSFETPGLYTVSLNVTRCATENYFNGSKVVEVYSPIQITLAPDAILCASNPLTLIAIEGYESEEGIYNFHWTDASGQVYGDQNSNNITVDQAGIYTVEVTYKIPEGHSEDENGIFNGCPSSASILVGPAFDFNLNFESLEVCYEDQQLDFFPDTPVVGEWYYERNSDGQQIFIEESSFLSLNVSDLPAFGDYEIIFVAQDPILASCILKKTIDLKLNELPRFVFSQTNPATNCTTNDGSIEITMVENADNLFIQETGKSYGPFNAGEAVLIENLLPGIYSVEAKNEFGCTYVLSAMVINSNPLSDYEYTINSSDEICDISEIIDGLISINFVRGSPSEGSKYRIVSQEDGLEYTGIIDTSLINIPLPHGEYSVEIIDPENCNAPEVYKISIGEKFQVDFSIPKEIISCQRYYFKPSFSGNIDFILFDPSGAIFSPSPDGSFDIFQSGLYTLRGKDRDGINCPKEESIEITIVEPIDFDVSSPIIDCENGVIYEAILTGLDAEDVTILWKDELGKIVTRGKIFSPSRAGNYVMEVQPLLFNACPPKQKSFTAMVLDINVNLELAPFCVDSESTIITVNADLNSNPNIEWYSIKGGKSNRLLEFENKVAVQVSQQGIYEVILRNQIGCEVGRARTSVIKSTLAPPNLPSSLTICTAEGVNPILNPGEYANYSWSLDGDEISNQATFTPELPGIYQLRVSDDLGCDYVATFQVFEDCTLNVSFPTAIVLNDSNRNFILYTGPFVDEAEVFIYNRWGELIFYCEKVITTPNQPLCPWDGRVNGELVINGTYAAVIKITSRNQNKTEKIISAVTVIQ